MPLIATQDAQGLFSKEIIAVYNERKRVTDFLRSFFTEKVTGSLNLSIEVRRGYEKIASDVIRGTEGNLNSFAKSTEKIFQPPYYRENFNETDLDLYDRLYGATQIDDSTFAQYVNNYVDKQMELEGKINRAYELQVSKVFETGIVTLADGSQIDYKRKSGSKVNSASDYFATNTNDPFAIFESACTFIRKEGKYAGGTFNAILGATAFNKLQNNSIYKERLNLVNMKIDLLNSPQMNAAGGVFHGTISAGPYLVNLWTYPQYYDLSGTATPYINDKKVIVIPAQTEFVLGYAAVPQLLTPNTPPVKGKFIWKIFEDEFKAKRLVDVQSAGLAIPVAVDTIYTFQAVS